MEIHAALLRLLLITGLFTGAALIVTADVDIISEGLMVTDGYPGGAITVIEVVKNTGDDESGPVTVTYYLINESGEMEPVELGSADLESLASGGDYSSVKTFMLPIDLADGAYKFVREAIGADSQYKSNETIHISDRMPEGTPADLVGTGIITTNKAGPGDKIRGVSVVENRGGSDSGSFNINYYLTNRNATGTEPLLIGSWAIEAVQAGSQATATREFTIPISTPPGTYGILMKVDPENAIIEGDDSNNDWYSADMITILGKAPEEIQINIPKITTSTVINVINNTTGTQ